MATKPSKGKKPGPNYFWNGREWVWIQQKSPAKKPPAAPPKPPPARPPTQTTQEWADQQAQREVDANVKAIEERERLWREGLQADAARRTQQAQAFAQMVQGMGLDKQIQGIFSNAGHDVAGFGAGFSGQVRETADASAQEMINLLGGQSAGVRNEGEAMGNVTHGMGGFIPSATLAAQGAAFASDAAMQPGFMLQQGIMEAERGLSEGLSENPFLDAILEAKMGKTEISERYMSQRLKQQSDARDFAFEKYESDRNYALKMMAYYAGLKKDKLANYWKQRAYKLDREQERRYEMENRGLDSEGNVLPGFYQDSQGRVLKDGTRYNAKGEVVKIAAPKAGDKKKGAAGMTPNQKAEILESTLDQEKDIVELIPSLAKQHGWQDILHFKGPLTPAQQKKKLAARSQVARAIWQRYSPRAQTPQAKAALRKMITRLLDSYRESGAGGAPATGSAPATGDPFWDTGTP